MRLSLLPLGLALMALTACQHHSMEGQLLEEEKISPPLLFDVSEGNFDVSERNFDVPEGNFDVFEGNNGGPPSVSEAPQKVDVLHLPVVFFPYDSWSLTPQAKKTLEHVGAWIRTHNPGELRVEGHTDPKGTSSYNYVLGLRRAQTVIRYLVNLGTDPKSMVPLSFGEDKPACHEVSAICDTINRRAAVFDTQGKARPLLLDLTDFTDGATPVPATAYAHD